jgi:hypothetical protein
MARIRILELPLQVVGEMSRTPFALIVDQVATDHDTSDTFDEHVAVLTVNAEISQEQIDAFAATIGAAGALVTSATLDVEV